MAVFIGDSKNTNAANCGLKINYAAQHIIQPAIKAKYPDTSFVLKQRVGIDTSPLFIAKTGIRGSDDLVWVGKAANNAAKMAALGARYTTYITRAVHDAMNDTSKFGGEPKQYMWADLGSRDLGYQVYGSTWWRSV